MRKLSAVALTATLMGVVAFGSIANAGTKLNLSVPDAASSSIGVAAQEFADQLNEKSGGELEVTVYFDGSLYGGDATAAVTTMQDGGLDMLCLATSWYASFDDSFNVIQIPYLFKSVDAEQAYLNDEASQPMWDAVEGMGVKFLAAWTRSFRMTTNNIRPITKPEDFAGIKLRTPGNQIYQVFFGDGCGANVTPMSFSELYTGLQQNVVDGQENPPTLIYASKFQEVQKYLTMDAHVHNFLPILTNKAWLDSLSDEDRAIVEKCCEEFVTEQRETELKDNEDIVKKLEDEGMEVNYLTEDQQKAFVEKVQPMYDKYKAEWGEEIFDLAESYNK